jgi:hypothetical protein
MTTLAQNQTIEQTVIIAFNGASLVTAKIKEVIYVAMRPIVEALGLDWKVQHRKISSSTRYGHMTTPLQTTGGIQEMLCIPLRKLNGWLFSINPSKVREDLRERVVQYQEECFEVLYRYWQGEAVQRPYQMPLPTMSDKRTRVPVKDAVTLLVAKSRNMNYSEAYGMIHQRFDVDSVEELTNEQLPQVIEYIHKVVCEFIGKAELPAPKPVLIADFSKKSVFEHKRQSQRHLLSLDVFLDSYGWEGNPLRRLFALLKQAKKDGTTIGVNDIEGAELVFSVTESLARQYKQSLDELSRHAANASDRGCYLPIQGC